MHLDFDETFPIAPADAYRFCETPQNWPRLFGAFTKVRDRGDGWYAVWIRHTPLPLITKITVAIPHERVAGTSVDFGEGTAHSGLQKRQSVPESRATKPSRSQAPG